MDEVQNKLRFVNLDGLAQEFTGVFNRETIERCVQDSLDRLERTSKVPQFIPLLAERFSRERLQSLAHSSGLETKPLPTVLFMCVHNAGRSQMAAAFMRSLGSGLVEARSAGSAPGGEIHATVVEAMVEVGLSLDEEFPKPVTDEVVADADVIVTMGCGDACPVLPGKRYVDWQVDDPSGRLLADVRTIREDIRLRVLALLSELEISPE
jgi:arsenate reductase (thioredoxin)